MRDFFLYCPCPFFFFFFGSCVHLFLFLLVIPNPVAFLLNVTSTVIFWMSACQSILCTVHLTWSLCFPDRSFTLYLTGCAVDRWTPDRPQQCSHHDMFTSPRLHTHVLICVWLSGVHGLSGRQSAQTKFLKKKLKNKFKKTVVNENFQSTVAILFGHFSVCCYCMYCINVAFIERCDCF